MADSGRAATVGRITSINETKPAKISNQSAQGIQFGSPSSCIVCSRCILKNSMDAEKAMVTLAMVVSVPVSGQAVDGVIVFPSSSVLVRNTYLMRQPCHLHEEFDCLFVRYAAFTRLRACQQMRVGCPVRPSLRVEFSAMCEEAVVAQVRGLKLIELGIG
ncbi:hypothetical protein WI98_19245 [Burkholderia vietnamiensis]|nr:hypothetical protein WK23_25515 [Burkholderia vietnamiensis]KVE73260.1 hypothetical protein WI98_19245 [Burkholderia vietnamiensis]KVF26432.1 hypothetical protein WJ08_26990 [Burkholderia vietnamiensis]KVF41717.1 hypothetical protein WJ10_13760 [Burkholderia vietnamiensis]TPQ46727.1 hypothetical protein C2U71_07225 [Burkholderia ubonensis]